MEAKYPIPSNDRILALSCSNVGVGPGGTTAMLAYVNSILRLARCYLTRFVPSRVSIVDFRGNEILDTFVAPTMQVSDYRTTTTGIEASHLLASELTFSAAALIDTDFITDVGDIPTFDRVQQHVAELIKGKVIVGHSLWHDLSGRVHAFLAILAAGSLHGHWQ